MICENATEFRQVRGHDIYNPMYKGGVIASFDQMVYENVITNGRFLRRVMKEDLFTDMHGLRFDYFHVFFKIFDRKIQQLFTGGITNHYIDEVIGNFNPKRYDNLYVDEPQILTLEHLEAGFVIWLLAMSFAVCIFMLEWLKNFKDFLVFKYVFITFCKKKEVEERHEEMSRRLFSIPKEIFSRSVGQRAEWEVENILPSDLELLKII